MADGFFRSKQGYTVVQNEITRDKTISLKAKGLYLVIQSYITMPDSHWRKEQFMGMVPEGRKAFDSAWNELKEKGYLHIHIYSDGKSFTYEYELLTEPDISAHTFYYNTQGEISKKISVNDAESLENTEDVRVPQKGAIGEKSRVSQKGTIGKKGRVSQKGTFGNGTIGNGTINNIIPNIDNTLDINPSVSHRDGQREPEAPVIISSFEPMRKEEYSWAEKYLTENGGLRYSVLSDTNAAITLVKYLAGWDMYYKDGSEMDQQAYILAVQCLVEMITSRNIYEYNGARVSYANVIDQINALCKQNGGYDIGIIISMCADHFVKALQKDDIRNKKQYMKSILWTDMSSGQIEWMGLFHRSFHGGNS